MKNFLVFFFILVTSISYSQGLLVEYSDMTTYPEHPEDDFNIKWNLFVNKNTSLYTPASLIEDKTTVKNVVLEGEEREVKGYRYINYEISYKNYRSKEQVTIVHYNTKDYRINEPLEIFEWVITDETKTIGKYTARLATTTKMGYPVDAWFTEEIPFSSGPAGFHGLPGLILEYSFGFKLVVAKSIDFKFNGDVVLPEKGIIMTRGGYENLLKNSIPKPMHKVETKTVGNTTTTTTQGIIVKTREPNKKN